MHKQKTLWNSKSIMIKKFLSAYWKSILITLGILYLSFASPGTFKSVPVPRIPHFDKLIHILMYTVLSVVLVYDFWQKYKEQRINRKFLFICILYPILLGGLVEIFQEAFFKPRSADWFDWFADIIGVFIGWAIMRLILKNRDTKTG